MSAILRHIFRKKGRHELREATWFSSDLAKWAFGLFAAILVILPAYGFFTNYCASNDDHLISEMLSGFFSGEPDAHVVYTNFVWASFVKLFYLLNPALPWWGLSHIAMVMLAVMVFSRSILKMLMCTSLKMSLCVFLTLLAAYAVYFYAAIVPNMATTASALGAAALILVVEIANVEGSKKTRLIDSFLLVVLMVLCYCYRVASFQIVVVLAVLVFLYLIITLPNKKEVAQRLCIIGAISCALVGSCGFVHDKAYASQDWQDFKQFNSARSGYLDFTMTPYTHDPALFKSVNVSESFAALINAWYMADSRIDADLYKYLKENSQKDARDYKAIIVSMAETIRDTPLMTACLIVLAVASVFSFYLYRRKYLTGFDVLFCWGLLACLFIFLAYVCILGRPILRAVLAFSLPLLALCISVVYRGMARCSLKRGGEVLLSLIFVLLLMFGVFQSAATAVDPKNLSTMKAKTLKYSEAAQFASEHRYSADGKMNIFIIDSTVTQDNRMFGINHNAGKVDNCISWGGWYVHSPIWKEKLSACGIDSFTPEIFLREDVYYICSGDVYRQRLLLYLNELFEGGYEWEEIAKLDGGVSVCRIRVAK